MRNVSFWHFQVSGTFKIGNTKVEQRKFGEQSSWRQIYTQKIILFKISNTSSVASHNYFGGTILLTLSEQQYFVCDTAPQSAKWQDMLEIWGTMAPLVPWLRLCQTHVNFCISYGRDRFQAKWSSLTAWARSISPNRAISTATVRPRD